MRFRSKNGDGSDVVTESGGFSSLPTDSLNGLKFCQKIFFENMGSGGGKSGGGSSSSAAASRKKGRGGIFQSGRPPRCQVEGCYADLSDAKAYYSRHKVCGMHSKFPMVIVAGLEQRFCQQCSRFHQLREFDRGKRSCRRRLADHNERRRKPPPGSLVSTHYGRLSPSIVGNGSRVGGALTGFSANPESAGGKAWSSSRSSGLASENQASPTTAKLLPQPWQNDTRNTSSQIQNSTGADSSCALSLLSNQPWGSSSRNHQAPSMNHRGMPMAQITPHGSNVDHFSSASWGVKANEDIGGSNEISSDLGLCQISLPFTAAHSEDLELPHQVRRQYAELMHPRPYDLSTQQTHWSLRRQKGNCFQSFND